MSTTALGVGTGDALQAQYDVEVARTSLDQARQQGQDALQLIDAAAPQAPAPPPPVDGKGVHINTYA